MNSISREVPTSTAITIIFGRATTTTGWFLFAFSMIFGWGFGGHADTSFMHFTGATNSTTGRVVEVIETNMEVNERSVWANVYEYQDQYGNEHVRDGFSTGRSLRVNQKVTVEYPVDKPAWGRIPGVRSAEFSSWLLLIWLLPLAALVLACRGILRGLADYKILKIGKLAPAKMIMKNPTKTEINDRRVYELTFEFTANDNKTYRKVLKTHLTEHLEDDEFERLFYNPQDPTQATLVDDLAGSPRVDDQGEVVTFAAKLPITPILWPLICVGPHLWYFGSL